MRTTTVNVSDSRGILVWYICECKSSFCVATVPHYCPICGKKITKIIRSESDELRR